LRNFGKGKKIHEDCGGAGKFGKKRCWKAKVERYCLNAALA